MLESQPRFMRSNRFRNELEAQRVGHLHCGFKARLGARSQSVYKTLFSERVTLPVDCNR
jgi:hypothetical protein